MAMQKIMVSMSDEMVKALEEERKTRKLETIPEVVRSILGEYFKKKEN
jgi:metal-responsive CopG/Arc/MetJ family transcriptional regulator